MPPAPEQQASSGLVIVGYVMGVLIPIVGFFVGLALILKARAGHGVAVMVLSVVVTVLAFSIAAGSGGEEPYPVVTPSMVDEQAVQEDVKATEREWDAYFVCVEREQDAGVAYVDAVDRCVPESP